MRRLNGNKKLKSRQKSIDNDNPLATNDESSLFFENAQDADADFMGGIGATLRSKKRRDRAGTTSVNNDAFQQLRKASSEVSDMVLYQQSLQAKDHSQQLSNSGESEIEKPEKILQSVRIMSSHSEDNNWTIDKKCMLYKVENKFRSLIL